MQEQTNQQVELIKYQLSKNAKYDSNWINIASQIISETDYTEDILSKFNSEQLSFIRDAAKNDTIPMDKFMNPELNATQMQLILIGYEKGIISKHMELFFNPNIPFSTSNYIIQALAEGYNDMINYIDFDSDQIYEIYAAHKDNVNYESFAKKEIDGPTMQLARHALILNCDVEFVDNKLIIKKEF